MKKVLYVATVVKTHIMEFHIPYLKMLKEQGLETSVAARNDYDHPEDCIIPYCDKFFDIPFERNPIKKGNLKSYFMLKKIIDDNEYDIIHCHTPVGAMITRLAAINSRKKGTKVIYTAHGFHFYKGAPLINWLIYYPVEKWLSHYTDVLITINKEDYERAKKFKAKRVEYVPGVGIDINKFSLNPYNKKHKREELGIKDNNVVILSVGKAEDSNYQMVLRALSRIKNSSVFCSIQYLICESGKSINYLKDLAKELQIEKHVHFLGEDNDISDLCNCCDLFIYASKIVNFPMTLVEAMSCGVPSLCINTFNNNSYDKEELQHLLFFNDEKELAKKILKLSGSENIRKYIGNKIRYRIKDYDFSNLIKNEQLINSQEKSYFFKNNVIVRQNIRKKLDIPLDTLVLLSVGEVNDNKNHKVIIELLPELKNIYYIICGSGPLIEEHIQLAKQLGVENRLKMVGYITNTPDYYKTADIFVFPSKREGLPVAVMEAMASELPVIAFNIRGNSDLIEDNVNGYLLHMDKEELLEKLHELINDERKRLLFGVSSRKRIKKYRIENTIKMINDVYCEVIE